MTQLWEEIWLKNLKILYRNFLNILKDINIFEKEIMEKDEKEKNFIIKSKWENLITPILFIYEKTLKLTFNNLPESKDEFIFKDLYELKIINLFKLIKKLKSFNEKNQLNINEKINKNEKINSYEKINKNEKMNSNEKINKNEKIEKEKKIIELFESLIKKITINYHNNTTKNLSDLSPNLFKIKNNFNLFIPSLINNNIEIEDIPKINYFGKKIEIIKKSKTKPKKIKIIGNDGKTYSFLLKGQEDLHLDEKIMQFLNLVNLNFLDSNIKLKVSKYNVVPLSDR
jgi:hypothetical protein